MHTYTLALSLATLISLSAAAGPPPAAARELPTFVVNGKDVDKAFAQPYEYYTPEGIKPALDQVKNVCENLQGKYIREYAAGADLSQPNPEVTKAPEKALCSKLSDNSWALFKIKQFFSGREAKANGEYTLSQEACLDLVEKGINNATLPETNAGFATNIPSEVKFSFRMDVLKPDATPMSMGLCTIDYMYPVI